MRLLPLTVQLLLFTTATTLYYCDYVLTMRLLPLRPPCSHPPPSLSLHLALALALALCSTLREREAETETERQTERERERKRESYRCFGLDVLAKMICYGHVSTSYC